MKTDPILVERTFKTPIDRVWEALTEPAEMKQWYFDIENFEPRIGLKFDFMGGPEDGPQYLHLCEITAVEEKEKLAHTWRYDSYPGNSEVTWQLMNKGEQTLVRLTHANVHTLEGGSPDFAKENFVEGWNYIIHTSLKNHLEGS